MLYKSVKKAEESEINITPMLDVVFILLIFFIVTTSFTKESGLTIYKSDNSSHVPKVKNAIIKLDLQNNHSVNGVATTLEGIQPLLANLKAANPDLSAAIVSSNEVKTGDLVKVIQQIKLNNISQYSITAY